MENDGSIVFQHFWELKACFGNGWLVLIPSFVIISVVFFI
jgi:hypothetical protein